jgi:hypothetical protein
VLLLSRRHGRLLQHGAAGSYLAFIIACSIRTRIPMPRCAPPGQRKQSHDNEKSRPCRIDNDAGCDLRTCICGRGRIIHPGLARCDRPLGPAIATRLQCVLSGDADGRDQCAPLSWRTEIERLTRPFALQRLAMRVGEQTGGMPRPTKMRRYFGTRAVHRN